MWKSIPGYLYEYRVSDDGEVQKKLSNGAWYTLKMHISGKRRACVHMRGLDNQKLDVPVVWLVADAFLGGRRPGMTIVHRNGSKLDCGAHNLQFKTHSQCARLSGGNRRRAVCKVDMSGNIVEWYESVAQAAQKNFMSKNSVWARCAGKIQNPYSLDGCTYMYDRGVTYD